MASLTNPAIPRGSLVLVTGVNGYLGSHVADQFLHYGYNVRGTVRDVVSSGWLCDLFEGKYGKGRFELVSVPDMTTEGAYNEVVKGTSAFIHVAAVVRVTPNPHEVIPITVEGSLNALKAAYAEPGVRRFVLTSSSVAVVPADPVTYKQQPHVITHDTWSADAVELAYAPPPYTPDRSIIVYSASKVESEKAVWDYHKEHRHARPDLVVNTVLPNVNFGKCLDVANQGYRTSAGLIACLWKGVEIPEGVKVPYYFVDVQDTGVLHVAAAVLPEVQDERIFAFAEPFNWNRVLAILRQQNPDRSFGDDFEGTEYLHTIEPRGRAENLLKKMGRPGWISLEDSVLNNTESLRKVETSPVL
ncbi:NAD dependent epimerase/dehydratase [Colletotrichum navitas]|uniref:NAD dependent epimerase/dehydratase n=1 Tax=Colletotrichum navitas TaxID=681940 RepID=A0AAD8PN73_9PEZI|nr:NAD dependent epimerase/dehydratase [Colletotrichum navitas]KAK1572679.1 NAD dependent epimerase/dehydratase [Colletotrichum navitas]